MKTNNSTKNTTCSDKDVSPFPNCNYIPGTIYTEEDIPPNKNIEIEIPEKQVKDYEKALNALTNLKDLQLRDKSFWLIIGLLLLLVIFYISDTVLINLGLKSSDLLTGVFELFKYMLSSLFGFVFALKHKEK